MWYSIYAVATGEIAGAISADSAENLAANVPDGHSLVVGQYDRNIARVDVSALPHVVIEASAEQVAAYHAGPPASGYQWDRATWTWVDIRTLADYKSQRIQSIKDEGVTRIAVDFPALRDIDEVRLVRELWLSIAPAARQPTAKLTAVINVYQAADSAISAVRAATTRQQVDAVIVNWP